MKNSLWNFLPYGTYDSSYILELEANARKYLQAIEVNHDELVFVSQYLWRNTSFRWDTCYIWARWLHDGIRGGQND